MTPDQLRRKALADGAELEIDGRVFNAERRQFSVPKVVPKPAAKQPDPPAPPVITVQGISQADVQAMLDARDAIWKARFDDLGAQLAALRKRPAPKYSFSFDYDGEGKLTGAQATTKGQP